MFCFFYLINIELNQFYWPSMLTHTMSLNQILSSSQFTYKPCMRANLQENTNIDTQLNKDNQKVTFIT